MGVLGSEKGEASTGAWAHSISRVYVGNMYILGYSNFEVCCVFRNLVFVYYNSEGHPKNKIYCGLHP